MAVGDRVPGVLGDGGGHALAVRFLGLSCAGSWALSVIVWVSSTAVLA